MSEVRKYRRPARKYRADVEMIAHLRKRLGWTQRRLATAVGVDPSLIAQLETDRCSVSDGVLEDIARELGVPVLAIGTPITSAEEAS